MLNSQASLYTPDDWYWLRQDGSLFGSKRIATVLPDDEEYAAWASQGHTPTPYPRDAEGHDSLDELQAVLDTYGLHASLAHYAGAVRFAIETRGITVGGAAIATDRGSQALINGAFNLTMVAPVTVVKFKAQAGFVDLDAAAVKAIASAVGAHVQAAFAKEAEVAAAIAAGTITTREQVDAAFAPAD